MVAAAIGLVLAGLLLGLFLGFFGFVVMGVGLVLFVIWLIGVVRAEPPAPTPPPRTD